MSKHYPSEKRKGRHRTGRRSGRGSASKAGGLYAGKVNGRVILLNKPYDVLCKFSDAEGRPTLKDYVQIAEQVYPAGRLDKNSEGLVILTDDGWLAHRITHPLHKLPKTYLVQVEGVPDDDALLRLRAGVVVKGRRTAPAEATLLGGAPELWPRAKPVRPYGEKSWLQIVLREGKKRQVRRMTAAVGYPTLRLIRVAVGPLRLGKMGDDPEAWLQPGQWRDVSPAEMQALEKTFSNANRGK